jgi:type VI secretion system secreted protein VgrG
MTNYLDNRLVGVEGTADLKNMRLVAFTGREELSRPFRYEVRMIGFAGDPSKGAVNPDSVLGKSLTVTLQNPNGVGSGPRHFNGIVTEFAHTGFSDRHHEYYAVIRPAFWLLTQRSDCRIFQKKSSDAIFSEVCQHAGGVEHRLALSGTYQPLEQRIQYHETDFDFVSRLLEHEGIYYYFEHKKGQHVMVLVDDTAKLTHVDDYEKISYQPAASGAVRDRLMTWASSKAFRPASYATRSYNFETPSSIVSGASQVAGRDNPSRYEIFEYAPDPDVLDASKADSLAKVRAQRMQSSQTVIKASGDAAGLAAGRVFTLTDHPVASVNKKYVVLATEVTIEADEQKAGAGGNTRALSIEVELLDAQQPYRPERLTPKPRIQGTQTAKVAGGTAHDVATDKYGRAIVQFYWDRAQTPSAFARVAQGWAGQGWGSQQLPRVGQEVVVSFLDGDPDSPIIIGSVYNAEQMPPYTLPDQKTRSGLKSRSLANGTAENFNEIRFEDKKGEEEVYIHAEKNLQVVVENNQTITIGAVKKDKGDRSVSIQNDDTLSVGQDRKVTVTRNLETTVTENETRTVKKGRSTTVTEDDVADIKKKFTLTAGDEISLTVGAAKIVMKKDGTIEISGKEVKLNGSAKAEVSSAEIGVSGTKLDLKGTNTALEGSAKLDMTSSGIASLKGSVTKIG